MAKGFSVLASVFIWNCHPSCRSDNPEAGQALFAARGICFSLHSRRCGTILVVNRQSEHPFPKLEQQQIPAPQSLKLPGMGGHPAERGMTVSKRVAFC